MTATDVDLAHRIAGHGLAGCQAELLAEPLGDEDWARLVRRVEHERMPGLLVAAIDDGVLPATSEQAAEAARMHSASMASALVLERDLLLTVEMLSVAGIESRVLKGSAVAHLDYPDPSLRSFGDIDVLVPAESFDRAVKLLVGRGDSRQFPAPRPDFDRRFAKGASFITARGRDIDLHRTFVSGPFGLTVTLPDLFATATPFTLAGATLLALGAEERFLHACFHAALGDRPPRLVAVRDVAQILLHTPLTEARVLELAERWRAEPVLSQAVSFAWDTFELPDAVPLSVWARRYRPNRSQQRALRAYSDEASGYAAQAAAAVLAIPGLTDRAAYLRALLFPQASYLEGRHPGYVGRIKRNARTLVHWAIRS
jgi:hypothetical protein